MSKHALGMGLMCLVFLLGWTAAGEAASGTLVLMVVDTSNSQPVAGATVVITLNGNVIKKAQTPANGTLTFTLEQGSNYNAFALKRGYRFSAVFHVNIIAGVTTRITMPLKPRNGGSLFWSTL